MTSYIRAGRFKPLSLARQPPAQIISDAHLINNLSHVLHTLILQSGELEKLCCLPHAHNVVLAQSVCQGFAAEALQTGQQIHVGNAQHVKHTLCVQLHGKKKHNQLNVRPRRPGDNQSLIFTSVKCRKSVY